MGRILRSPRPDNRSLDIRWSDARCVEALGLDLLFDLLIVHSLPLVRHDYQQLNTSTLQSFIGIIM